jgi:hypothetical protein
MEETNDSNATEPRNNLFSKPIYQSKKLTKNQPFIQNSKPYPENNNPSVKSISSEKIWNLKNIQIALFVGFLLLILDIILLYSLSADVELSLMIVLFSVIIYAITLYFLLNPPNQKTIEKERIKTIEKPTIKIVEKPVIKTIEKPAEETRYIDKPVVKQIASPAIIINDDPLKKYPFVASIKSKKIHSTKTTAGRMIKPENREFAHKVSILKKKGYVEGQVKPRTPAKSD